MNWRRLITSVLLLLSILIFSDPGQAGTYFFWNAETYPCDGSELPNPPFWTQNVASRGHVTCGSTPEGGRFIEFQTVNMQHDTYTEIHPSPPFPIENILGKTLYLAFFFNFTRINGLDIWYESDDSADKGIELVGSGVRWIVSRGHWANLRDNLDHHYTVWGGNPSYHLNPSFENYDIYRPNQCGYSADNPIQLKYETWYSAVMAVKMASDYTGSFIVWINGVKILQYDNIRTTANSSPNIEHIFMDGTIAQPAYNAPAHKRQYDALMLTDNWQDIINGGYLVGPGSDTTPPEPPKGVRLQ